MDALVVGSAAGREKAVLPGAEGEGLDCCAVYPTVFLVAGSEVASLARGEALGHLDFCLGLGDVADPAGVCQDGRAAMVVMVVALAVRMVSEDFGRLKQVAHVVVAPGSEGVAIPRPRQTANLLRMDHDACQQRHLAGPVMALHLPSLRPLDGVVVDQTDFVAH